MARGTCPVERGGLERAQAVDQELAQGAAGGAGPLEQLVGVRVGGADEGEEEVEVGIGRAAARVG